MKVDIKTEGVEITPQMRERLDWICSKLEKMAAGNPAALHCDITVAKAPDATDGEEFRADIRFFDASGETHHAKASARNPLIALDIAHDEIEREFFKSSRILREKTKLTALNRKRELQEKTAHEEPLWRVMKRRRFGDEE